jgi:hypothetical protein
MNRLCKEQAQGADRGNPVRARMHCRRPGGREGGRR